MSITSPEFMAFVAVLFLVYYAIPKAYQWLLLLAGSYLFYLWTSVWLGGYILFTTVTIYAGGMLIARQDGSLESWKQQNADAEKDVRKAREKACAKHKRRAVAAVIVINLGILAVLKYYNFLAVNINGLGASLPMLSLALPLGISFYTFQSLGYLIDLYRGLVQPQRNILKLSLFICYFPTVMQGPISRYDELGSQLYAPHAFSYADARGGIIRFAWGMFKKLVIADRLGVFVGLVYDNWAYCSGPVIALGTVVFAFQLYTDFSGYMDMTIGVSQMLGIRLAENFNTPFFSHSITEYWRRWHITLGGWLRDYLFYPTLKSGAIQGISKGLAKQLGKKRAKRIATNIALFILWFMIGLWHGASWNFVIGTGLLHWAYIVLGEACGPLFTHIKAALHISGGEMWFKLWQQLRTFLLVCVGFVFFRSETVGVALRMLKIVFKTVVNPQIHYPHDIPLAFSWKYIALLAVCLLVLLYVSIQKQRQRDIRAQLATRPWPLRWAVYLALAAAVALLSNWDMGDLSTQFIYYQF